MKWRTPWGAVIGFGILAWLVVGNVVNQMGMAMGWW